MLIRDELLHTNITWRTRKGHYKSMITIYVVEMRFAKKESSRMKQAGASKGFYIQSKVEYRGIAFETIGYLINGRVVVY